MQEAITLTHLSEEILQIANEPAMLYCDNQGVIKIITDEELKYSKCTKHLDLHQNILTKSLHVSQVKHLTHLLNLVDV